MDGIAEDMDDVRSGIADKNSTQISTTAERIQQLNKIDESIAQLLHSAGLAIKCLTLSQDSPQEIQTSKDAFTTATQSYLDQLHSVNTQFKRNAVALRQAGIIPDGRQDDDYVDDNAQMGFNNTDRAKEKHKINVDVGWLNSRSGKVGVDYEAELWAKARRILEEVEDKKMGKNQANT